MKQPESINIIIVDDHEIFRNGLKMVINRLKFTKVAGEAANGLEFLDLIKKVKADIVLMDIEMPVMNGIDATKAALAEQPDLKIIALTMFNESDYIQSMMEAGVKGFLLKNIKKELLAKAINTVYKGGNYYSEELFEFFTKQLSKPHSTDDETVDFTRREKEILQLMAEGLNNKEIADMLFISERTVVGHKTNMLSKTGCKSTLGLLTYAIKHKAVIV